jgi:hypothetical protein
MEIIIGTTAINRPELHSDNMGEWYNWINSLDKTKYNINWFINVDYIPKLEKSVEDTIQNFQKIIQEIPTHFLTCGETGGNFLQACKRVSSNIAEFITKKQLDQDKIAIIWLEDDWKLSQNNIPLQELLETYFGKMAYINLSYIRENYVHALAPSIIHWNLWKQVHLEAWTKQESHIDPEHCVGQYFIKNFGKYNHVQNITIINKQIKESYLQQEFICREKSYYTYYDEKYNIFKNEKHIDKLKIPDFCKDTITFLRISMYPSFCQDGVNYGRIFMEKYNIKKTGVQNDKHKEFYT